MSYIFIMVIIKEKKKKNQLFKKIPSEDFVIKLLNIYGINGFDINYIFTKDSLILNNTLSKINEIINELEDFYLPCKKKIYLKNITIKRAITILRQFVKVYNYNIESSEKFNNYKKYLEYKLSNIEDIKKEYSFVIDFS